MVAEPEGEHLYSLVLEAYAFFRWYPSMLLDALMPTMSNSACPRLADVLDRDEHRVVSANTRVQGPRLSVELGRRQAILVLSHAAAMQGIPATDPDDLAGRGQPHKGAQREKAVAWECSEGAGEEAAFCPNGRSRHGSWSQ